MVVRSNKKIIESEGNRLIGKSEEGKTVYYFQALDYAKKNANLKLTSENRAKIYREYMEMVAKIKSYSDYENSITWWKVDQLVKLQSLSKTNDNIVAQELIRRYVELRNSALELICLENLQDIISHLPLTTDDDFSPFLDWSRKENPDVSQEIYDLIKEMLLISDSTNLDLDVTYGLNKNEKVKK